jgi:hypothetical protein
MLVIDTELPWNQVSFKTVDSDDFLNTRYSRNIPDTNISYPPNLIVFDYVNPIGTYGIR